MPTPIVELLDAVRFERPWALWLLLWPLAWVAVWLRRRPPAFVAYHHRRTRGGTILWFAAVTLLIVGFAGPRWGKTQREGVAIGRDVVLVIDLSRSMLATDLSTPKPRWKAATEAAADLVRAAGVRGGHRIGVVIFAAKAKVLVPLTTDYDHLLQAIGELDGAARPLDIRPDEGSVSGTRIGTALKLAVETHDPRYAGVQDIILLSDGDDPADDREWADGIPPARALKIPVHAVGIGGGEGTPLVLPNRGRGDELVSTRLRGEVLAEIAWDTGGQYLPAGRDDPQLGSFFHRVLEPQPFREFDDDPVAVRRDRSGWFLAAGFVLFLLAWWRRPI